MEEKKEVINYGLDHIQPEILQQHAKPISMDIPTEIIELPSNGLLYDEGHPLKSGTIELKYPTAKNEDILLSQSLIQKGTVIDVFLESLICDKRIRLDDMLVGDKDALYISSRILLYGPNYNITVKCPECGKTQPEVINLSMLGMKELNSDITKNGNRFECSLPISKKKILFRLMYERDIKEMDAEAKAYKKHNKNMISSNEITSKLKKCIISVEGSTDVLEISKFVDMMPSQDSLELRGLIDEYTPGINRTIGFECDDCGHTGDITMPITVEFFWCKRRA